MVRKIKVQIKDLNVHFGALEALKSISLEVYENEILSIIGPSNSGKSTFLRCLNRFNDTQSNFSFKGILTVNDENIFYYKNKVKM